jgi:hypothetical protein
MDPFSIFSMLSALFTGGAEAAGAAGAGSTLAATGGAPLTAAMTGIGMPAGLSGAELASLPWGAPGAASAVPGLMPQLGELMAKSAAISVGSSLGQQLFGGGQKQMPPMLPRGLAGPMTAPLPQIAPLSLSGANSGPNAALQRIIDILRSQGRL